MHKLLQVLEPGDPVAYVTPGGTTLPALLLSSPHPITRNPDSSWVATVMILDQAPLQGIQIGSEKISDVMFSEKPQTGCFFLTQKQQWMQENWLVWKNGSELAQSKSGVITSMGGPMHGGAMADGTAATARAYSDEGARNEMDLAGSSTAAGAAVGAARESPP